MNKRSALIVGGGIAGLAAAAELAGHHFSTTVLEAKNRFGGRIHTLHEDGVPIELGAEFVHGRSQALLHAIGEAKLSTRPVPEKNRLYENDQFREVKIWEIVSRVLNRVDIRKPDCSIEEFLSGEAIAEPDRSLVRHFIMGFDAAYPARISAHARRRAEYAAEQIHLDTQLRINEGYSKLIEYFRQGIEDHGGRLVSGMPVRRLRWQKGKVEAQAGPDHSRQNFSADVAVIALPLGVLKTDDVAFEPSLPEKIEAARDLQMGNVVKIIFHFRDSIWDDFGFVHLPSEPIPTWWSDPRGPTLTGWAGGPNADALSKLSAAQLESVGLHILTKLIFGSAGISDLRKRLVSCHYYNWAGDPHIRGAYSYIPVNGLDLPKLLAAPVAETLFFAGEATVADGQTGTVFGALETGLRAAKEILQS